MNRNEGCAVRGMASARQDPSGLLVPAVLYKSSTLESGLVFEAFKLDWIEMNE
jgi:hypothetical protein